MTDVWPSTVPTCPRPGSLNGELEDNRVEFTPEAGPPKRRRRTSIAGESLSFVSTMTPAQLQTLLTFYKATLADGTLPFSREHPRTGVSEDFIFTGPPRYNHLPLRRYYDVSLSLRQMP